MLRTIQLYEQLSYFEASKDLASEIKALEDYLLDAQSKLTGQVDALVKQLYAQITSNKLPNKDGFFGGIHKWWKNLWGRNSGDNPYYWQNRIGALGRSDLDPPTVEEYKMLKHLATSLEEAVEAQPLLITKILNGWSSKLHNIIGSYFDGMLDRVRQISGTSAPGVDKAPAKEASPEEESPPEEAGDAPFEKARMPDVDDEAPAKEASPEEESPPEEAGDAPFEKARMPDVDDEAPIPSAKSPTPTPASFPKKKSLDELAADLGIKPDMKTNLGPSWEGLSDVQKQFILDACKEASPHCPTHEPAKEEDLLSKTNKMDVHRILRKHDGKSVESIKGGKESVGDSHEKSVILAVHEPWLSLTNTERKHHNDEGSGGVPLKGHNRRINGKIFPFRLPPVLRRNDPRFGILRDYYPELFAKLNNVGRAEREDDTPDSLAHRIKRNIRTGKVNGEFTEEKPEPRTDFPAAPLGDKKKKRPEKSRMPAMPEDDATESVANRVKDFPEEISKPILSLLEKDEGMAKEVADAWESVKDASEYIQARFKEMLEEGDFKAAISHATDFDEDDEIKGLLNSNFKPKGPTLLEALKTRLKLQREGRATQWKPLPDKVEVTHLVERLRQQSKERFNASGAC